ncbi:hypothetical protein V8B97DRAFT_2024728 [Scleroderma yunnanense]
MGSPIVVNSVVVTLLLYDYALTFAREIDLFWKRPRRSWPFALFSANRYITMLGHVPLFVRSFWSSNVADDSWCVVDHLPSLVMCMRIHALYQNNRSVLIYLLVLALGAIVVGCWAIFFHQFSSSTGSMTPSSPLQEELTYAIGCPDMAVAWSGQLVFDFSVFLLTLWQSLRIRTVGNRNVTDILLRDGAIICGANIVNIAVLLDAVKSVPGNFTNVISSLMISRLMLNLRDPNITTTTSSFPPLSHASMFATPVCDTDGVGIGQASMSMILP